jgi:hypothetical protein
MKKNTVPLDIKPNINAMKPASVTSQVFPAKEINI